MSTCRVCGGDIKNGRCQGCGMSYTAGGNASLDSQYKNLSNNQPSNTASNYGQFGTHKKKKSPITILIIFIVCFFAIASILGVVSNLVFGESTNIKIEYDKEYDAPLFEEDEEDIWEEDETSEETNIVFGDNEYWAEVSNGVYIAGTHIPVGTYDIELSDASEYSWAYVEVFVDGYEVEYQSLDAGETMRNIELLEGSAINIDSEELILITSDDALDFTSLGVENPLTQTILIKDDSYKIAGIDFPAGTYDVYVLENDYGSVQIDLYNNFYSYQESFYSFYEDDIDSIEPIRNIEIPTGTKIATEDLEIELVPSQYDTLLAFFEFEESYVEVNKIVNEKVMLENYQRQSIDKPMQSSLN